RNEKSPPRFRERAFVIQANRQSIAIMIGLERAFS
ncbi:MAG: hypothetical protein RL186_447, partial [Pseudomonadota bacterium]